MMDRIKEAIGLKHKYVGDFCIRNIYPLRVPKRALRWKEGDITSNLYFIFSSSERSPTDWKEGFFGNNTPKEGEAFFRTSDASDEDGITLGDRLQIILGRSKFLEVPPDDFKWGGQIRFGLKVPQLLSYEIVDPSIAKKEPNLIKIYDGLALKVRMKQLGLMLPEGYKNGDDLGNYACSIIHEPVEKVKRKLRINVRTAYDLVAEIKKLEDILIQK